MAEWEIATNFIMGYDAAIVWVFAFTIIVWDYYTS